MTLRRPGAAPELRPQLLDEIIPSLLHSFPSSAEEIEAAARIWRDPASDLGAVTGRTLVYVTLFEEYSGWRRERTTSVHESGAGYSVGARLSPRFLEFLRERSAYYYDSPTDDRPQFAHRIHRLIGDSSLWHDVKPFLRTAVGSSINTLITGETGTGKDQIARMMHELGNQATRPYLHIPATSLREGQFLRDLADLVQAAGMQTVGERPEKWLEPFGTVHISRASRLPLRVQEWFLAYLRELDSIKNDVYGTPPVPRVLFSSSVDLEHAMRNGAFLKSLYYDIGVFQVYLPSLKQRREAIPTLAEHLLRQLAHSEGLPVPELGKDAIQKLKRHPWPGNLAELRNVLIRALWHRRGIVRSKDILFDRIYWGMAEEADDRLFTVVHKLEEAGLSTGVVMIEQIAHFLLTKGWEQFKTAELTESLGCAPATARSYLQKLRQVGIVNKIGEKKATRYRIKDGWLPPPPGTP